VGLPESVLWARPAARARLSEPQSTAARTATAIAASVPDGARLWTGKRGDMRSPFGGRVLFTVSVVSAKPGRARYTPAGGQTRDSRARPVPRRSRLQPRSIDRRRSP